MTMGVRIQEARKEKGFTQEYIAEQLGVSRQAVSKWEKNVTSPDTKNLIALAQLLDTSVAYLATGRHEEITAQSKTPVRRTLYAISIFLLVLSILCTVIGLFSGEYTDMATIPAGRGVRIGIPFLLYGKSPLAIGMVIGSWGSFILAVIFAIIAFRLDNQDKT